MTTGAAGGPVSPAAGPEVAARDAVIGWFRGEFAAANAVIDALCGHLAQIGGAEYDAVFAALHRRRLNWFPVLHMQKFYSVADVTAELRRVAEARAAAAAYSEEEAASTVIHEPMDELAALAAEPEPEPEPEHDPIPQDPAAAEVEPNGAVSPDHEPDGEDSSGDSSERKACTEDDAVADGPVAGDGIILQDLKIENTAGPEKHQAVALRVSADRAVINRCRVDAYQDTLYAHQLRQFYRDSAVSGTVDFVFGNAAAVLQNCVLTARRPMQSQKNAVTAQGRVDPNQNTGTSVHKCRVVPAADLEPVAAAFPTFLGRPWKAYSRTVYMRSYLGAHVDPRGWLEWDGDFALKTLFYGEYQNEGPGAGTAGRVKWPGYRVITDPSVAVQFTVGQFIQGANWLKGTGVAYNEGL